MFEHADLLVVAAIVAVPLLGGVLAGTLAVTGRRSVYQESRVGWFRKPRNRPAVYVMQSLADRSLFKVGYTSRKVETRKAEIERTHGPVRILLRVRMPHAYAAEMRAHRTLPRKFGVRALGGEWYRCASAPRILRLVLRCARGTRRSAKLRFSWPHDNDISIWRSEHA